MANNGCFKWAMHTFEKGLHYEMRQSSLWFSVRCVLCALRRATANGPNKNGNFANWNKRAMKSWGHIWKMVRVSGELLLKCSMFNVHIMNVSGSNKVHFFLTAIVFNIWLHRHNYIILYPKNAFLYRLKNMEGTANIEVFSVTLSQLHLFIGQICE